MLTSVPRCIFSVCFYYRYFHRRPVLLGIFQREGWDFPSRSEHRDPLQYYVRFCNARRDREALYYAWPDKIHAIFFAIILWPNQADQKKPVALANSDIARSLFHGVFRSSKKRTVNHGSFVHIDVRVCQNRGEIDGYHVVKTRVSGYFTKWKGWLERLCLKE